MLMSCVVIKDFMYRDMHYPLPCPNRPAFGGKVGDMYLSRAVWASHGDARRLVFTPIRRTQETER